ncbi:cytochrome c [Nitratireductor sp. XY-223]|uniref:c-type cytochrome n=1 Tax=Nitratireductor sp. XY-223 TaxID=2561926 RepID=UPI0010A9F7EA|nr:cytochrome c [Nitratireductor sp. XY-223]
MKRQSYLIAASVVTAISAAAYAHTGATGIVKERMDAMSVMSKAVKSISKMMMGETPYDADVVKQGAALIKNHAGEAMTSQFPEGSLQKPSVAKPEIWTNWDEFVSLADRLGVLADGLEAAADNGPMMAGGNAEGHMMGEGGANMMGGGSMMGDGASGMMSGSGNMMGGGRDMMLDPAVLARMPADGVFNMLAQTCSSCHTKFRIEKK